MFLPPKHEVIEQVQSIDLEKMLFKGEIALIYNFRDKVLMHLNEKIDGSESQEEMDLLLQWFRYRNQARWWEGAKKQMSASEMAEWIVANAVSELRDRLGEESFKKAAGVASESDLEDAQNWVESASFQGSPKQVKWAKDIALKNLEAIAMAWKQEKEVPVSAKWWIENRHNIVVNLPI